MPTTTTTTVFTASPNAAVRTAVAAQQPGAGGPSTTITGAGTPQTFTFTATRTGVDSFTQSGFVFETSTTYPPSSAVQTVNGTPSKQPLTFLDAKNKPLILFFLISSYHLLPRLCFQLSSYPITISCFEYIHKY